jgi:hypothetical protein
MMNFCACRARGVLAVFPSWYLTQLWLSGLYECAAGMTTKRKAVAVDPLEEATTHIDIAHGDTRHDCRYVALYLRSGGGVIS